MPGKTQTALRPWARPGSAGLGWGPLLVLASPAECRRLFRLESISEERHTRQLKTLN